LPKSIWEKKRRFEITQRVFFVLLLFFGIFIILCGVILYFIPSIEPIIQWSSVLGIGLGLFGGLGTFLTSKAQSQKIRNQDSGDDIIRPEYRQRNNIPIRNYIKSPTQGIFVFVLFLVAGLMLFWGGLILLHWVRKFL